MVTLEAVKTMKVQELKEELKTLGLSTSGVKAELAQRLEEAISGSSGQAAPESEPAAAPSAAPAKEEPVSASAAKAAANGRAPIEFKPSNGSASTEAKPAEKPAEDAVADKPAVAAASTAGLTEAEKARQRAERFGIVTVKDKLAARAKRFGIEEGNAKSPPGSKSGISALPEADKSRDAEKLKERAKRFAIPESLSKEEAELKKKARLERFGGVSEKPASEIKKPDSGELAAKLAARAERFALSKGPDAEKASGTDAAKPAQPAKATSAAERKDAAQARAAALVKPAANAEQEAKRQARAIRFQAS